ncbi:hypothetical protein RB595_010101 [Gaeumannomyces hyphopodioides]
MWAVKVDKNIVMDQNSFEVDHDDMVAVSVTNGTRWNNTNMAVSKLGRSTNVYNAEAWGFNSAVNVANGTHAFLSNLNITSHNGAIGLFAYGPDTHVRAQTGQVASTGPAGHAVVAVAGSWVEVDGLTVATGGMRSSVGAAWGVGSSLRIQESTASTAGVGSPCLYASGGSLLEARNLSCEAGRAPFLVVDASLYGSRSRARSARAPRVLLDSVDGSAGMLAAVVIFDNSSTPVVANKTSPVASVAIKATSTVTAATWANTTVARPNTTVGGVTANSTALSTKTRRPQPSAKATSFAPAQIRTRSPVRVTIKDSEIRIRDTTVAGVWIANTWASVQIFRSSLVLEHSDTDDTVGGSRVLVRAGGAVPTRDMDSFTAEPHRQAQQLQHQPNVITAQESTLEGDVLAAGDGGWVDWRVTMGSTWIGTAGQSGNKSRVDVSLSATSSWTMTGDAHVSRLRAEGNVPNIDSRGFMLYYNARMSGMAGTFDLPGGGRAVAIDM